MVARTGTDFSSEAEVGVAAPEIDDRLDGAGQPTQDPMEALGGALAVWGGHKGSGLALVVQLLGMMSGAATAPDGLRDCGFFLLVIDPGLLTSDEDYKERVAAYADLVRDTWPVDPSRPVRVPFDRSVAERERRDPPDVRPRNVAPDQSDRGRSQSPPERARGARPAVSPTSPQRRESRLRRGPCTGAA